MLSGQVNGCDVDRETEETGGWEKVFGRFAEGKEWGSEVLSETGRSWKNKCEGAYR